MSDILQTFNSYSDFEQKPYFTLCYNELCSMMALELSLTSSKKNLEEVVSCLNLSNQGYEIVYKNWLTEDTSNADHSGDYPCEQFFQSTVQKSMIWILLSNDILKINFYYDVKDTVLEKWVITTNHKIRSTFGKEKTPTFKVLTRNGSYFDTEEVETKKFEIEVKDNYNEDFIPIHNRISEAVVADESGLILLYGHPGTGKTTYIKNLISSNVSSNFIFIQNEFVSNLLDPDFISFLLNKKNAILIIEDAEKVLISRDQSKEESVVSTILQLTDGLFSDYLNIKIICTFNSNLSKIDKALLRKGRMIAMYEFKPLSIEKSNKLLNSLGANSTNTEMTVADIFNHEALKFDNLAKPTIGF